MISTYRELMLYIDGITTVNESNINDLKNVKMDLSNNIQIRVDIQLELFIKEQLIKYTKEFQSKIKSIDSIESFQLQLINLKTLYKLLYTLSKIDIISEKKSIEIGKYIKQSVAEYQKMLKEKINVTNNEQFNIMINNTKLTELEDVK